MNSFVRKFLDVVVIILMLVNLCAATSAFAEDEKDVKKDAKQNDKKAESYKDGPTSDYEVREVEGWKVYVLKRLTGPRAEVGDKALRLLRIQLLQITTYMPEARLKQLREVPIWLDDRTSGYAQYHPERKWLEENGYNLDKTKCVDISQAEEFVKIVRDQPCVALHELAHAYHDRVLGFDDKRIVAAYDKAVEDKKYESVLKINGRKVKHYALTDHKEYFAECTEAYFGTNDFYPFVRAELKEHDPAMFELLREIWHEKGERETTAP